MKYCFIHDHRSTFRVKKMCRIFNISRSSYYGWKRRQLSVREKENEKLMYHIREAYTLGRKAYGSPRITNYKNKRHTGEDEEKI
jgi:putative transposase